MKSLTPAPFGTWESALTPATLTSRRVQISGLRIDGVDTYWVEHRLNEGGRHVLLKRSPNGVTGEVLPMTPFDQLMDVRTNVNEYGGRAYAVADGLIVANQISDGRVYRFDQNDPIRSLVPLTSGVNKRYGDFELDLTRGLVYAVEESHQEGVNNRLVAIPLDGSAARDEDAIIEIFGDADFVAAPALSPDGLGLAWISWEHPHMPWTQSALHVSRLTFEGRVSAHHLLVDLPEVCVFEPRWSLNGDLVHIDDTAGWSNFYRTEGFDFEAEDEEGWIAKLKTRVLHPAPKAFSTPHWRLGLHTYDNYSADEIACSWMQNGSKRLGVMNLKNGQLEEAETPWHPSGNVACDQGRLVFLADSELEPPSIVEIKDGKALVLRDSADLRMDPRDVSVAQPVSWRTSDGQVAFGYFYEPRNARYLAPQGSLPPVIVNVHAGPTSAARTGLSWEVQFWTQRGFAYLDVDFRGSTGHGKPYREVLNGNWGTMDVQDVREALDYVVSQGLVDPDRAVVRGFSSGAFTAVNALRQDSRFKAASAVSGYWDLRTLKDRTAKFESYLVDRLASDNEETLERVSPLSHPEEFAGSSLLLFQGTVDGLSSLAETEEFAKRLEAAGVDCQLEVIPGEDHYMQSKASVERIFEVELDFYRRVLGL
ncbi:hypothetical protein BSR29_08395 [Boudabousia liubingyangii]|uniref:Peptidase S9 prolyl oligopeptidase catalytic domain-containing protein n=1 Tax=Boudabousia liubingyangii TaxID=1921764 RepID=A0A1Q5PJE4_9ACTO|nr:prolyl oligopeptidase family serine peptidase [Boudabousia liubingyangii]OKL45989.1 hypothetical protein BSR29_08395 [Boudabousia liubingyangii]OKL47734.1 hypothetical protein BSR28_04430 [Boudabousia liubingyangii]